MSHALTLSRKNLIYFGKKKKNIQHFKLLLPIYKMILKRQKKVITQFLKEAQIWSTLWMCHCKFLFIIYLFILLFIIYYFGYILCELEKR